MDALEADFHQYYHLDIYEISKSKAIRLIPLLPEDSRLYKKLNPELAWGWQELLLSRIEYYVHGLIWRDTKDAKNKRNAPELIEPDFVKKARGTNARIARGEVVDSVDNIKELLSRGRK